MANAASDVTGTLISWEEGIGDDKKYHVAHVAPAGMTLVCKLKDHAQWQQLVAAAKGSPDAAATLLQQQPKAIRFAPGEISKATYAQKLWQLTLFDRNGKKTVVPPGKEQAQVFEAVRQHLGGTPGEEEADAWSVMQSPLFTLAVISVIGGFFIYFTTICEADYEADGRRQGMKNVLNWLGYKIGPVWMSVAVGSLAALVLGSMISQLIKRPVRQVLTYEA